MASYHRRSLTAEEREKAKPSVKDPVKFINKYLFPQKRHTSALWWAQARILRALVQSKRVAVKACHASGKTFVAALAVLWWISRYPDGIAVTTAPTWLQVEKLIWGEIHKAVERGKIAYPSTPKMTELYLSGSNYAIGLSTNEAERFQGFHEGHVLIVMDEAPGVREVIYEAIEGIRAGGHVRLLALGNPTIASGHFYNAFAASRKTWSTQTICAFHTPNLLSLMPAEIRNHPEVIDELNDGNHDEILLKPLLEIKNKPELLERNTRPYLTRRDWVLEKYYEWFLTGSPLWDARVMGRFPKQSTEFLFPLSLVEFAKFHEVKLSEARNYEIDVGIDVAGPGEAETVMYVRRGPNIIGCHDWQNSDPRGDVLHQLNEYANTCANGKDSMMVRVDNVGLGHYFTEHIRDNGYNVIGVNVQERSEDKERYSDLKSEFYSKLRERFDEGLVRGLTDEETISQLTSIKYKHNAKGLVVIQSKDDARKDGFKSPDRAEALMLCFADISGSGEVGFV